MFGEALFVDLVKNPVNDISKGMFDLLKSMGNGSVGLAQALSEGFQAVWPHVTKDNIGHLIVIFLLLEGFPTMAVTFRKILEKNVSSWTGVN